MPSLRNRERAQIIPMFALMLILLMGFMALVIDFGTIFAGRRALQNAADAAALAGAKELESQMLGGASSPATAALKWAGRNGVPNAGATCAADGSSTVTYNQPSATTANSWEVMTSRLVHLTFAPVVGVNTICVQTKAVAVVTEAMPAKIYPWGLLAGTLQTPYGTPGTSQSCESDPQYCFTLKEGAGGSTAGNFGILDFTCQNAGAPDYNYWSFNGYGSRPGESIPGPIPGNSWTVCTTPGNKAEDNQPLGTWISQTKANPPASCTNPPQPSFECPLIGLIPILKETSWPNGRSTVTIVNFAIFELEGVTSDTQGGNGHLEVLGQFLKYANAVGPTFMPGASGGNFTPGALGIRLIQ